MSISRAKGLSYPFDENLSSPVRKDFAGIIGNTVLVNSGSPHAKEFRRKLYSVWARVLKKCSPSLS